MIPKTLVLAALLFQLLQPCAASAASYGQLGAKLVGALGTSNALQGTSVAISSDGNTAVVGGYGDTGNLGAVWVYARSGGAWSQQGAKLVGSGGVTSSEFQGGSVAVSADGNTLVEGGSADNSFTGAAWVFTRSAGAWTQQGARLVGTGPIGAAHQGGSVAISADGNTLLVGGSSDNASVGAAWVYTRSGGVWSQQGAKLVGAGVVGGALAGTAVSLSADGNTAAVGGYNDNSGQGAVWIFVRNAGVWSQQGAKLLGTAATGTANQGMSVSLSGDGNTLVEGGWSDNGGVGAAWVFTRSGNVWTQQGSKLVGTGAVGLAYQGISVAVSSNGSAAAIGGYNDNGSVGAAWVFTRSGGVWNQQGLKLVGSGATGIARQGISVSLSGDGAIALVGGYADNSNAGAVWAFVDAAPTIVTVHDVPNDQGGVMSVRWNASLLDNVPATPISSYWIWRQVPIHAIPPAALRSYRTTISGTQVYYWEFVGSQVAHGFPAYSYTVPTLSDSVPGSNPCTLVLVESERASTGEYWSSSPDSGYSVDNLPPGPPAPVAAAYAGGATRLHWGASPEPDFAFYRVYRGGSAGFVPGPGNLVASLPDTGYADAGAAGAWYKLSAVDIHGNESNFALITPGATTGVGADRPPAFALGGVSPNPSRGTALKVAFSLPTGEPAVLELLDVNGRRVFAREIGSLGPGRHSVSLAGTGRTPPGLYWVRLTQGANHDGARVAIVE